MEKAWWKELEESYEKTKNYKWCCRLVVENGFEEFIQNEIGLLVGLRLKLNFCPHCGNQLTSTPPLMDYHYCCYLFRDLGLDGMQYEETVDEYGKEEVHIHRLIMRYCFHCGEKIKRPESSSCKCKKKEGKGLPLP